jgi:hypothetical protein
MSGLATLCNSGPLIEIDGRGYQVKGRTLRHLGEAESQILFIRGDLLFYLRTSVRNLGREEAVSCCEKVLRRIRFRWIGCNGTDITRFYSSLEGRVYSFWQSIRDNGVSYEEANRLYFLMDDKDDDWESRIKWTIELVTGEADISKLYRIAGLTRPSSSVPVSNSYLISRADLFSTLFREPFGCSPEVVADMTLGQITMILTGKGLHLEDLVEEKSLMGHKLHRGTRMMLERYTKSYREMAENVVDGLSLTSGLVQ